MSFHNSPVANKRSYKDEKFGYGGKKKGGKANTRTSTDDVAGYKPFRAKGGKKPGGGKMATKKRMGKERRQKNKGKNK
jgi:rRNA-processing protein EBP2